MWKGCVFPSDLTSPCPPMIDIVYEANLSLLTSTTCDRVVYEADVTKKSVVYIFTALVKSSRLNVYRSCVMANRWRAVSIHWIIISDRHKNVHNFACTVPRTAEHSISISSSSSLGSRCVPWLGEDLSMSSPNDPVLWCPLPYRVAPVFVQVICPPLGWSPLSSYLVIWSPSGDARGPLVVFEAVDMPCPGPFHFSQCRLHLWPLSSPWPRCWSFYLCMWCWAYFFPFWSVRPQVCSVLAWSVSRSLHHMS